MTPPYSNAGQLSRSPHDAEDICEQLTSYVAATFGPHPFAAGLGMAELEALFPDFLGLSLSFRYLQAAAQKDVIFDAMRENREVPIEVEMMNAVGNFLTWDECGGVDLMQAEGKSALPKILDTGRFHSNMFRADAHKILGRPIQSNYRPETRKYLTGIYDGLASTDVVVRCAHMVAFEIHASAGLESLWKSIVDTTGLAPEELPYFARHVGGADPAEKYHVEMTQRLVERVVPVEEQTRFREEFRAAYQLHVDWCSRFARKPAEGRTDDERAATRQSATA